jgi:16S rRNA (cytosine967-C5)-methyltransferase
LKPGGRLVYATCSFLPQENEQIASAFSEAHGAFKLVPAREALQQMKVPDAAALCDGPQGEFLRLWPHRHATDGFFAAIWERGR